MRSLTCDGDDEPVNDEAVIVEAHFEPQRQSIWVPLRRYIGALFIYLIYWLTIWGAFTRVVGATLSPKQAADLVKAGAIDSVWEYGWGNHYIWFLIVFCFATYFCAVLSGATAKKRGAVIAAIANFPIIAFLALGCALAYLYQMKIENSLAWGIVLPTCILGSVFFSIVGGSAGERFQTNLFPTNTILGVRPLHWWWLVFPTNLAIQVLVPKIVAAVGLLLGSTFVIDTKYCVMLFLMFVAIATFVYFIAWGWYKAFCLLSVTRTPQFSKCGIAFRVLLLLFGIPILGESVCVIIYILVGRFF